MSNTSLFRKPPFWIIFALLSALAAFFSYHYFSKAFPIVQLKITMNREQALLKAQEIAKTYHLGPDNPMTAASFDTDYDTKTYVELDAGGKEAFAAMLKDDLYMPYYWHVRFFKQFEKNEVSMYFKPDGTPYGFKETVSENATGTTLDRTQALQLAHEIMQAWKINLDDFKLVEQSQEEQPSKRIDHYFVFERPNIQLGKAYYRLKITVSGDKVTELNYLVKVPEDFTLRYKEMRSANNSLALGAQLLILLLYIIGGCILGLFFLIRQRRVLWKTPLMWGIIVALLHVLVSINQLPLAWMRYDTALSMQGFLLKQCVNMLIQFLGMAFAYGLIFAAAESLTRKAFGNHIQLWKSWSSGVANSYSMFGRTIGGYLMVPLEFTFTIIFYIITTTFLKWWTPSEALTDPNVLATYFPWLSAIVLSLGAGFMEECLFRAVPIAGCTLLGNRFGNRKAWLVFGFILQALIFGAAHANYPSQPAYSRIVELIFFSIVSGLIYLYFGLIPCIISHFTYDVVWFSLPLFVSTAANAWINKAMVIALTLIPLAVIIWRRLQAGTFVALKPEYLNKEWHAPAETEKNENETVSQHSYQKIILSEKNLASLTLLGVLGLLLWLFTTEFKQDAPALTMPKKNLVTQAHDTLKNYTITPGQSWNPLSYIGCDYTESTNEELQHTFIWQHGGKKIYHSLIGHYLKPPRWVVRYATFDPNIPTKDRAQEYHVVFTHDGQLFRFHHVLPETAAGDQLEQEQARELAHTALKTVLNIDPTTVQEISAVSKKQPNRKDWLFTFSHKTDYPLEKGQARISVEIDGNQIVDVNRYVHVPEEWQRTEKQKKNGFKIITILCILLFGLCISFGLLQLLKKIRFSSLLKPALCWTVILLGINILSLINIWPSIVAHLDTSEPYTNQLFMILGAGGVSILIRSALVGLILAIVMYSRKPFHASIPGWISIYLGLFAAGINSFIIKITPKVTPLWAEYTALGTFLPFLGVLINAVNKLIYFVAVIIILCAIYDHLSHHWTKNKIVTILACILSGLLIEGMLGIDHLGVWLGTGIGLGLVLWVIYYVVGRYETAPIPLIVGTFLALDCLQQAAFNAWPNARLLYILAAILLMVISSRWTMKIKQRTGEKHV